MLAAEEFLQSCRCFLETAVLPGFYLRLLRFFNLFFFHLVDDFEGILRLALIEAVFVD